MKSWGKRRSLIFAFILFLAVGLFFFFSPELMVAQGGGSEPEAILQNRLGNAVVLYTESPLALVKNTERQVDSANVEVVPYVKQGRVLVPLRFLAQNLQAEIAWEQNTSAVTLTVGKKTVQFLPGDLNIRVNGKEIKLDTAPEIVNGRTFVPIRAISEAFGKKVFYDRGLIVIGEKEEPFNRKTEKSLLDQVVAKVNNLPTVNSYENLKELLADLGTKQYYRRGADIGIAIDELSGMAMPEAAAAPNVQKSMQNMAAEMNNQAKTKESSAADYSQTNVQVQGVDEADIVKTDGEYLYHVNKQRVLITKAYPVAEMQVVSTLNFNTTALEAKGNFQPQELYLDDKYLVVVGHNRLNYVMDSQKVIDSQKKIAIWPPRYAQNEIKVLIYDIQDKKKITKLREVEVEGRYLSSRKIGPYLYFVTNCPTYLYQNGQEDYATPIYRDSVINDDFNTVPYQDIRYIPPVTEANYLVIAGLNLERPEEKVQLSTYLGAGENLYVSQDNLYVALQKYNRNPVRIMSPDVSSSSSPMVSSLMPVIAQTPNTQVYKFSLDQGKVTYLSKGEVPGTLLNQFSMDEHKKYFRVATTTGDVWSRGENMSQNNVYVLDESMSLVGKVEGIAPGERIYSARFMGDRAYLVTFKDTDPFFVLDLKQPSNPYILGALKIPGYSDYLHPYDENHVIGIGKDTVEIADKSGRNSVSGSRAYYQGMKLAVFDVTDVTQPKEMFKEVIGDRGTDSELLRNHKALLFDREKELLAFPVSVMEIRGDKVQGNFPQYGQFAFQGAYVYKLNLKDGFSLRGKITHLTNEDLLKAGYYGANAGKEIKRILYIKDALYTLSDGMVKANGMAGLAELGNVALP